MNKKSNEIYDDDSIDLIELLSKIWKGKIFIIKSTFIFTLIGIFYSLSLENIFTSSSVFYPHYQNNEIGQSNEIRGIAGLAGINLGSNINSNDIPTNLYPNIINSPNFKLEVLDSKIIVGENEISYRDYLLMKTSPYNLKRILLFPITFLSKYVSQDEFKTLDKNIDILELNKEEYSLHKKLNDIITITLNEKEGFIELSVIDNDPLVASQIAKTGNEILQKNIIDFKLKNLNDTYKFISQQLDIAKNNFYKLQDSLAVFSDKNRNIKSDLFLNKYSRIESEYNISKNIYNELALSKERTAIDVKKNTPIFTIIKPVVIPNEKSDPKRSVIVITFSFIGLIIMSCYTLLKHRIFEIWKEINK